MEWQLAYGDEKAKTLAAQFKDRKIPLPPHLIAPRLRPVEAALLRAFWELSSDRPVGMGVGGIYFVAIDRYAARFGIDDRYLFGFFMRAIRAIDGVYLKDVAEKSKADT